MQLQTVRLPVLKLCTALYHNELAVRTVNSKQAPAHLAYWSAPTLPELRRWVKWAGGPGRREGVHMVHTFEEIRTRTPANPNEAAPEAIMPQAAWEALLWDGVHGLCPPYTPQKPSANGSRPPTSRPEPSAPPPHGTPTTPGREGHGQGEGKGQEGTLRQGGREEPKVTGRRP